MSDDERLVQAADVLYELVGRGIKTMVLTAENGIKIKVTLEAFIEGVEDDSKRSNQIS
jgi:hypothetical protein